MIQVTELMSDEVKTLPVSATMAEIYQLMRENNIRHVPIVHADGALLGIVSYLDVMAATPSKYDHEARNWQTYSQTTAGDIMKSGLETMGPDASARQAARLMEKFKIGCLPIVNNGRLIGIITDSDFLSMAINLMEQIDEAEAVDDLPDTEV